MILVQYVLVEIEYYRLVVAGLLLVSGEDDSSMAQATLRMVTNNCLLSLCGRYRALLNLVTR